MVNMRKRLEKHCGSVDAKELRTASLLWSAIKTKVLKMIQLLDDVGQSSYQLTLGISPEAAKKLFDANTA